jgi:aryl-alcohol dehydrogenase-like predicted oxidoreductase
LHDVVKAGKARYIGASGQFQKALHVAEKHGWTRFVSMQIHLNRSTAKRSGRCCRSAARKRSG